jgi:ParB family transcriptional regulator, chromosome partitioning protein
VPRSSLARASLRTPMQAHERDRVQRQLDEAQFGRGHLFLKVDDIRPNPRNPRKVLDQSALNALADSIKQHGQLQPIVVRRIGDDYELIAGERRWRACKRAQLERVWAVERHVRDDFEAAALAFIENAQRVDLSREEKVAALDDLAELVGSLGLRKLASEIKVAPSWLSEQLKVRRDPDVFPALEQGQISVAQAAALSRAPAHARRSLLDRAIREHPEYRIVRQWVDDVRQAERKSRAQIAEGLAKGTNGRDSVEASASATSQYITALNALHCAGQPESLDDRRILQAIVDHCQQLLGAVDRAANMVIAKTRASRNARNSRGAA